MPGPKKTMSLDEPKLRMHNEIIALAAGDTTITLELPEAVPAGKIGRARVSVVVNVFDAPKAPPG